MTTDAVTHLSATRRQVVLALTIALVLLTGVGFILFGPGRGARDDIANVRTNLAGTRATLASSLGVQQQTLKTTVTTLQATQTALTATPARAPHSP